MKTNKIKLILLTIFLIFIEVLINNLTPVYIDLLGVLLVIWLLNDSYSLRGLAVLSILADLIGHWYLGSHLMVILVLSFVMMNITHFYRICSFLQKNVLIMIFYSIFCVGLIFLSWLTGKYNFSLVSYIVELIICVPFVNYLFFKVIDSRYDDIMLYD